MAIHTRELLRETLANAGKGGLSKAEAYRVATAKSGGACRRNKLEKAWRQLSATIAKTPGKRYYIPA